MFAAGCLFSTKPPPPPLVPANAATVRMDHFIGTPLSGPLAKPPGPVNPADALSVEVTLFAVEHVPAGSIESLGPRTRMVVATRGATPLRPSAVLTRSAGIASGPAAERFDTALTGGKFGRTTFLAHNFTALSAAATAVFETSDASKNQGAFSAASGYRHAEVDLHRPEGQINPASVTAPATSPATAPAADAPVATPIEVAVVFADFTPETPGISEGPAVSSLTDAHPRPRPAQPTLQQETILLDPETLNDQLVLAVLLPFRFHDGDNEAVAAVIRIHRGTAGDLRHDQACLLAAADLQRSYAAASARIAAAQPATPDMAGVESALASLGDTANQRPAIAFLAGWSGAKICEDVALSADDAALSKLAGGIAGALATVPRDRPAVAWAMDHSALDVLAKLQADNKLPPELSAVLCDRAGEAARHPSAMEEILSGVAGPDDLAQRLLATNMLYLEDSSPASRARAFQWLRAAGRAPAGYDPLGPPRERRAALDKAAAAQSAVPANTGGAP